MTDCSHAEVEEVVEEGGGGGLEAEGGLDGGGGAEPTLPCRFLELWEKLGSWREASESESAIQPGARSLSGC